MRIHAEHLRCLAHRQLRQLGISEVQGPLRPGWRTVESRHHRGTYRTAEERRHRVPDLPEPMPYGRMEPEPVWEGVEPGGFPHGDAPRYSRMNGPWRREGSSVGSGACAQGIRVPVGRQAVEPAHWLGGSRLRRPEPPYRDIRVPCPSAAREDALPIAAAIAEIGGVVLTVRKTPSEPALRLIATRNRQFVGFEQRIVGFERWETFQGHRDGRRGGRAETEATIKGSVASLSGSRRCRR